MKGLTSFSIKQAIQIFYGTLNQILSIQTTVLNHVEKISGLMPMGSFYNLPLIHVAA